MPHFYIPNIAQSPMISVGEAEAHILGNLFSPKEDTISWIHSERRILANPIRAQEDIPPFDRVSMDGIALRFRDWENGVRTFRIAGLQRAGSPRMTIPNAGDCLEVMTGAVLPEGADSVIRYEDVHSEGDECTLLIETIRRGMNIHGQGSDRRSGEEIIPAGTRIGVAEKAALASLGAAHPVVFSLPRTVIISTGDELVEPNASPLPHQIRKSNVFAIESLVKSWGIIPELIHLPDDAQILRNSLETIIRDNDLVILSGGVSKGKFDLIPEILIGLGTTQLFHRIAQRPGKPMWFGKNGHCMVFALPGNPVSTFMCSVRYLVPWLKASLGQDLTTRSAVIGTELNNPSDLSLFPIVSLRSENGSLVATPCPQNGSGDYSSLIGADAFLQIPPRTTAKTGELFPVYPYRTLR